MTEDLLWRRLQAEIEVAARALKAVAGIYVRDLTSGSEVAVNADEISPTASTIKIHILTRLMQLAETGELDLNRRVHLDRTLAVPGSGVLAYLDDLEVMTVRDIATLMVIASDNTATNLCIDWAGIEGVNALIASLDLRRTSLRRKMQDHAAVLRGDENLSTPREVVGFLTILYEKLLLSPSVCTETLRVLRKPKRAFLTVGLPEGIEIAGKAGAMDRVRNDAAIVFLPRRPYAICVMTRYGLAPPHSQERFIADIARCVHEHMSTLDATNDYGQGVPVELRMHEVKKGEWN